MTPELAELRSDIYDDLYAEHYKGTGCCLHIVADDFNIEDSSVDLCLETAQRKVDAGGTDKFGNTHEDCLAIAKRLRALSLRDRAILFALKWCPNCETYEPYEECCDCRGKLVPIPSVE